MDNDTSTKDASMAPLVYRWPFDRWSFSPGWEALAAYEREYGAAAQYMFVQSAWAAPYKNSSQSISSVGKKCNQAELAEDAA
jgi:hypothetical protein